MSRRKKEPLRPLTEGEREALAQMSRSQAAPAAEVTRAKLLSLVASGPDYQGAARAPLRRVMPNAATRACFRVRFLTAWKYSKSLGLDSG